MNILITGCSKGIGYELTRLLCSFGGGHTIIGVSRSKEKLAAMNKELKEFTPFVFDLNKVLTDTKKLYAFEIEGSFFASFKKLFTTFSNACILSFVFLCSIWKLKPTVEPTPGIGDG